MYEACEAYIIQLVLIRSIQRFTGNDSNTFRNWVSFLGVSRPWRM